MKTLAKPAWLATCGLTLLFGLGSASAQTTKPGLWEIQSRSHVDGQAMPDMAAAMKDVPPQMRQQMEAMMAQQGVGMSPRGIQVCVTPEQAKRNAIPVQDDKRCQVTWQKPSGKRLSYQIRCNNPPSQGEGWVEIISETAWKSDMTMRTQEGGRQQSMRSESSGRWLGPDCGRIKPAR